MATDYDAPRKTDEELAEESLDDLKAARAEKNSGAIDVDEAEAAENLELPGADLSDESLTIQVLPRQADEFTCSKCFLVHHRSQLEYEGKTGPVCSDCS
ncbi:MAG TPA: dUTPase [Actinobacteria bacterium]|nr:dUTPase [Actinomycetota bacterium]